MATTTKYGHVGAHFASGDIIWTTHTIKVVLLASTYVFDGDAQEFYSDLTNELPTANGYTAGGATLGTKSLSYVAADDATALLAANTVWTAAGTLTARYAVVYRDNSGVATTSPLICIYDHQADFSATNDDLTIDWNDTGGVVKL